MSMAIASKRSAMRSICGCQIAAFMPTPWMNSTGVPDPARMKPVPSGAGPCPAHADAKTSAMPAPQFLEVLVGVADAVRRMTADRRAKRDHQLVRRRRIADLEMHGQVMRAPSFVVLVHKRDHDRRVRPAAQIGEGKIGL